MLTSDLSSVKLCGFSEAFLSPSDTDMEALNRGGFSTQPNKEANDLISIVYLLFLFLLPKLSHDVGNDMDELQLSRR